MGASALSFEREAPPRTTAGPCCGGAKDERVSDLPLARWCSSVRRWRERTSSGRPFILSGPRERRAARKPGSPVAKGQRPRPTTQVDCQPPFLSAGEEKRFAEDDS